MSDLSIFLKKNAMPVETIKQVISNRFKDKDGKPAEWELRALTAAEDSEIRKRHTKMVSTGKRKPMVEKIDREAYLASMVAACVVNPDLTSVELQQSYGVIGEGPLVKQMLTNGEYTELLEIVTDISGFDRDINDEVEEAKN